MAISETFNVEEEIITTKSVRVYRLDMTAVEAKVLRGVLSKVSGDPATTRRGLIEDIKGALDVIGITYVSKADIVGGIEFLHTP